MITVTTPPHLHYEMEKKALLHNKHLLLEKPTTSTALEARHLTTLAQDRNLIGMVAHEFRWTPANKLVHKLVVVGKVVGPLREVHCTRFFGASASSARPPFSWSEDSRYDHGISGSHGSHNIDEIRSLTNLEFKSLIGQIYTRNPKRRNEGGSYRQVTSDDGYSMIFELEKQVTGSLNTTATMSPSPSSRTIQLETREQFTWKKMRFTQEKLVKNLKK